MTFLNYSIRNFYSKKIYLVVYFSRTIHHFLTNDLLKILAAD